MKSCMIEKKELNLDILEMVIKACEGKIKKLGVQFSFANPDACERLQKRIKEDEADYEIVSEDDSEKSVHEEDDLEQQCHIELLNDFEKSVILKQYKQKEIEEIEKVTGARILIVPCKIKYFSWSENIIDDAKSMIFDMKENLNIHKVIKYGEQLYQSQIYSEKLGNQKINITKIANKCYFWYDDDNTDEKVVQRLIQEYANEYHHQFYPLSPQKKERFPSELINLIIQLKATVFEKFFDSIINEDVNHVELSRSRQSLIIHCKVIDQAAMPRHQLIELYENLVYFFFHFTQEDQAISNIEKIQNILNASSSYWLRKSSSIVIGCQKKNLIKLQEKKKFLNTMQSILNLNQDCVILALKDQQFGIEENDQAQMKKNIMIDQPQRNVFEFSLKNKRVADFIKIIQDYIVNPKLKKSKKTPISPEQQNKTLPFNHSSSMIHDTTSRLHYENTFIEEHSKANIEQEVDIIPADLKKQKKEFDLDKYNVKIEDSGEEKVGDDEEIKKGKSWLNIDFINQMLDLTGIKYRPYLVKLPEKYMNILKGEKDIVTMFVRAEEGVFKNPQIQSFPLKNKPELKQNGWLVNIPKRMLQQTENEKFTSKTQKFKVIKYLKLVPN